jgi:Zn-dependent M16 (insulinase) family peptidase
MITFLRDKQTVHGFTVRRVTPLPELRAVAYELAHDATGARLLHLHADDTENLMAITFPTPPTDDTGVAHILEHTALNGSRRFPVRTPLLELWKMSLATIASAMTGVDYTCYPFASNHCRDLFNLAEVYCDLLFHPLLTERSFQREGHHLAPANPSEPRGRLTVTGIVYNEMQGSLANPEWQLWSLYTHGLLPDTCYRYESGGDPRAIPDLTHEQLCQFHAAHYHPSNAYFFCYGDIPTADYAAFLGDRLASYGRQPVPPLPNRQPRWTAPVTVEDSYAVGPNEPTTGKTYLALRWLIAEPATPAVVTENYILGLILFGHEAAPLRHALLASRLGQDVIQSGDGVIGREETFGLVLKGSEPDRLPALETLVRDTLTALIARPLDPALVASAFQQAAYFFLEVLPHYPYRLMERTYWSWLYGGDPLAFVRMKQHLDDCQRRHAADPGLFHRLIRERLLDNPHQLRVILRPDAQKQARDEADRAARLKAIRDRLSDAQLDQLAANAAAVQGDSGRPNTPEALATLPQLTTHDLPPRPTHLPTTIETLPGGVTWLRNDVFSNGVNYLHLSFDLRGLPSALWPQLPRYCDAIAKLGAASQPYDAIARRVAASTGGITCAPSWQRHATDSALPVWRLQFTLKALDQQMPAALAVLRDLLFAVDPRDRDRLRAVLTQSLAGHRTALVQNPKRTAALHAGRGLTEEGHLANLLHGPPQLVFLQTDPEQAMADIEAIRDFLLNRQRLTVSFTGSNEAAVVTQAALADWIDAMRADPVAEAATGFVPFTTPPREGLVAPVPVASCTQLHPAPGLAQPEAMALHVGHQLVDADYLFAEVRLKGHAYGTWFGYLPLQGMLQCESFRDPHVARTLEVFAGVADFVERASWTQTDIDRVIIGSTRDANPPLRPAWATGEALLRYLTGQTPEFREMLYDRLRAVKVAHVRRALLTALAAGRPRAATCVVASRAALEAVNQLAMAELLP